MQQGKKGSDKPDFSLKGENEEGCFFLEFSFSPRKVTKNRFEKSSDAAYIFPMPLIQSGIG